MIDRSDVFCPRESLRNCSCAHLAPSFLQVGLSIAISFTVAACLSRGSQIYEKVQLSRSDLPQTCMKSCYFSPLLQFKIRLINLEASASATKAFAAVSIQVFALSRISTAPFSGHQTAFGCFVVESRVLVGTIPRPQSTFTSSPRIRQ